MYSLLLAGSTLGLLGPPPDSPPVPDTEPVSRPVIVVFVATEVDELLEDALRAIRAHAQGRPVDVVIERSSAPDPDLREQMRQARRLADRYAASGVFWLDLASADEFLLYLFEPQGLRVLVRRIPTSSEDQPAAIEALGVIVGSSSEAIAAGQTIGMTPVETDPPPKPTAPEPEPAPPPVREVQPVPPIEAALPPPSRAWETLRLSVAYAGTTYAPGMRWQSGASLALSAAVAPRVYLGLDYTLLAPDRVARPVPLQLWRHPIALHVGFHQGLTSWLAVDAELSGGVTVDAWRRTDTGQAGVRPVATVAPWLFFRFVVWRGLSVDVGLGGEVALNDFDYVWTCDLGAAGCPSDRIVLDPDRVRGRVRGGLSYSF